jgi:hypothetical protein
VAAGVRTTTAAHGRGAGSVMNALHPWTHEGPAILPARAKNLSPAPPWRLLDRRRRGRS